MNNNNHSNTNNYHQSHLNHNHSANHNNTHNNTLHRNPPQNSLSLVQTPLPPAPHPHMASLPPAFPPSPLKHPLSFPHPPHIYNPYPIPHHIPLLPQPNAEQSAAMHHLPLNPTINNNEGNPSVNNNLNSGNLNQHTNNSNTNNNSQPPVYSTALPPRFSSSIFGIDPALMNASVPNLGNSPSRTMGANPMLPFSYSPLVSPLDFLPYPSPPQLPSTDPAANSANINGQPPLPHHANAHPNMCLPPHFSPIPFISFNSHLLSILGTPSLGPNSPAKQPLGWPSSFALPSASLPPAATAVEGDNTETAVPSLASQPIPWNDWRLSASNSHAMLPGILSSLGLSSDNLGRPQPLNSQQQQQQHMMFMDSLQQQMANLHQFQQHQQHHQQQQHQPESNKSSIARNLQQPSSRGTTPPPSAIQKDQSLPADNQ
eukprot:GDKJ01032336.1.p1 GENE.GDKJ01032336.1~~GDKJ01032336.1.p1  ORF type:complete len:440 (+),score=172.90 GDKJ01032336.1:35-1321(+)